MNKFMRAAIKEAYKGINNGHGGPFGAVIVKDGKIVGRGHNQVVKNNDPTCHGEVMAIHSACKKLKTFDLSGCEIYTTGEPCPMCMGAILWSNMEKVYYGCNIMDTENIGFRDNKFYQMFENRENVVTELNRKECLKLFEDYSKIKEKTHY